MELKAISTDSFGISRIISQNNDGTANPIRMRKLVKVDRVNEVRPIEGADRMR